MRTLTAFLLTLSVLAASLAVEAQTMKTYELNVGNFTELKVRHGINVEYKYSIDSAGYAVFTCNDSTCSAIVFSNKKGKLDISLEPRTYGREHLLPKVTVMSAMLSRVSNEGDSSVVVLTAAPCPVFKADLIGNGTLSVRHIDATDVEGKIKLGNGVLSINGKCRKTSLGNTGTGSLQAGGLQSEIAECRITGTGTIDCTATLSLVVRGLGTGCVYYAGNPKDFVNKSVGVKAVAVE